MKKTLAILAGLVILAISMAHPLSQVLGSWTRMSESTAYPTTAAVGEDVLIANGYDHVPSFVANTGALMNFAQTFVSLVQYTNATTSFSGVPAMQFNVSAGRQYSLDCDLAWASTTSTGGPKYTLLNPQVFATVVSATQAPAPNTVNLFLLDNVTTTTFTSASIQTFASAVANTGVVTAGQVFHSILHADINEPATPVGASGLLTLQAAANGSGTLTIFAPSRCRIQ